MVQKFDLSDGGGNKHLIKATWINGILFKNYFQVIKHYKPEHCSAEPNSSVQQGNQGNATISGGTLKE